MRASAPRLKLRVSLGEARLNPYDAVPYESLPCPTSHPDAVGAIGRLLGLRAPAASECRVLELGCGAAGNLLPMACAYPKSRFVGVDLAAAPIEAAGAESQALGLDNVRLEVGDVTALGAELGTFDFVIAHGVYSWVPPAAQQGLLRVIRACLAEEGMAYVSFSVLPGGYVRQSLREVLQWRTQAEADPLRRVAAARRVAEQLLQALPARAPHGPVARRLLGELVSMPDGLVLHDYLAEVHEPLTVTAFAERAAAHQLQLFADAELHTATPDDVDPEAVAAMLGADATPVARQRVHDVLTGRPFRGALLCRSEHAVEAEPRWERLGDLWLTTSAEPRGQEDGHWMFRGPGGALFGTTSELVASALAILAEAHPRPVPFRALCERARAAVDSGAAAPADIEMLGRNLLAAFTSAQISLGTGDRVIAGIDAERPKAFAYARQQARRGLPRLTTLEHRRVDVTAAQAHLVTQLDGTQGRDELGPGLDEQLAALAELALLEQ